MSKAIKTIPRENGTSPDIQTARHHVCLFFIVVSTMLLASLLMATTYASAEDKTERGPDAPSIYNEFTEFSPVTFQTHTVTFLPNEGTGDPHSISTDTGTVTLPDPESLGFSAPAGSIFVGWSTDPSGRTNVYSQDVTFPDNASHTAALDRDANLYAIWLPSGNATSGTEAYFYIRADGTIPFEPSQGAQSEYIPKGSGKSLEGSLRQPIAVTNNPAIVAKNLLDVPDDETLSSVLKAGGIDYEPKTQKIVWYVIKSRQYGGNAWNVDGVIVPLHEYIVYYNPNGGYSNVPTARAHLEDSEVAVDFSVIPARPGYDFLGWAEDPAATTPDYPLGEESSFTMPSQDKHLYAVWTPRYVNIDYQAVPADGGSLTQSANVVRSYDGDGITGSNATPVDGYLFEGWYKNSELVTNASELDYATIANTANRLYGAFSNTTYTARFVRASASMTASKEVLTTPSNGEHFVEGEAVLYSITVTNTGNTNLTSVIVNDTLGGTFDLGNIAPGQSAQAKYTYQVTSEDATRGYVINEATINAQAFDGKGNSLSVPEQVVGAGILTGVLPDKETYVLYGAYPDNGGSIGRNYEIVNADTGDGLTDRTAVAKPGYRFAGWYEDDVLISNAPTLTASEMHDSLNRHPDGTARAIYTPTLFIAHFVPDTGDPEKPNPPVGPTDPDGPETPDTPDDPLGPNDPSTPSEPPTPGDINDPTGAEVIKPTVNDAHRIAYIGDQATNAPVKSSMPPTGDGIAQKIISLFLIATAAAAAAFAAYRENDKSNDARKGER